MTDAWQMMDDWCVKQNERLRGFMDPHVLSGRDLNDPAYRAALGQSQALGKMRSFIHGARNRDSDSDRDREADETQRGSVPEGDRARARKGIAPPSSGAPS